MKKLWILFTALALLAVALPAVADVTTGAQFYWYGITDLSDAVNSKAAMAKARIKISGNVDEFNTIATEFRFGNGDQLVVGAGVPHVPPDWDPAQVRVKKFNLATDITGALGLKLPVTIKSVVGVWESDFYGTYATRAGWSFVNGNQYDQNQVNGAAQLDVGIGPVTAHYYQDWDMVDMMAGLNGAFGPVSFWAAYASTNYALGKGNISADAAYTAKFGDIALSVYPAVNYSLEFEALAWDAGVKVGFKQFTVAASVGGNDTDILDLLEAEVGAAMGKAALWLAFYDQFSVDSSYGLDIMGSYKFGAATFYLGYVLAGDGVVKAIPVDGAEWDTKTGGLYAGVKCDL
jgi:hypothetical protein